jgi:hypothetical protein
VLSRDYDYDYVLVCGSEVSESESDGVLSVGMRLTRWNVSVIVGCFVPCDDFENRWYCPYAAN